MERMSFVQSDFNQFLVDKGVVGFKEGEISLKSGKKSRWYANFRELSKSLWILERTAQDYVVPFIIEKFAGVDYDCVLGVPQGATLLGNKVQEMLIKEGIEDRLYFVRDKAKEHGDVANKYWTNGNVPRKAIVFEDVATSLGSTLEFVKKLRSSNVEVVGLVSMLDRLQLNINGLSVSEVAKMNGLDFYSMTNAASILPFAYSKLENKSNFREWINEEYRREYETEELEVPFQI